MEPELQRIEDELKTLVPQRLDPAFLDCLAVSMGDEVEQQDEALHRVEDRLRQMKASGLSAALLEKLSAPLEKAAFQAEPATVPFPQALAAGRKNTSRMPWIAVAAAVALAGAWTAVKISPSADHGSSPPRMVQAQAVKPSAGALPSLPATTSGHFQPASVGSDVRGAEDLGVRYNRQAQPMRVIKVTYMDRMKFLDEKGQVMETTVPRVEYIVLPERVD